MTVEKGSITPEYAAAKPPTALSQITVALNLISEGERADVGVHIAGTHQGPSETLTVVISPTTEMLHIGDFNDYARNIFERLKYIKGLNGATPKFTPTERYNRRGGIKYPHIDYGSELIGKRVTTTRIDVRDDMRPNEKEVRPFEEEIKRDNTRIVIAPSPQLAELAYMTMTGKRNLIPIELRREGNIQVGITERQLKLLKRVTPNS